MELYQKLKHREALISLIGHFFTLLKISNFQNFLKLSDPELWA